MTILDERYIMTSSGGLLILNISKHDEYIEWSCKVKNKLNNMLITSENIATIHINTSKL